jgi:chromosome segregation ATPase
VSDHKLKAQIAELEDQLVSIRGERDAAHAHADEALEQASKARAECREARNEAATVRRAYLHEKHRAETAIAALRAYDPKEAARLVHWEYEGAAK